MAMQFLVKQFYTLENISWILPA